MAGGNPAPSTSAITAALEGLLVRTSRGILVLGWRWRTELAYLTVLAVAFRALADLLTGIGAGILLAGLAAAAGLSARVRRLVARRFGRLKTRHGLQAVFVQVRLFNRYGRLPLILRIRPTPVGERVLVWFRPGICAEDLAAREAYLGAACWARDVRVARHARYAQLAIIEVIRRDPLAATAVVASPLPDMIPAVPPSAEPEPAQPATEAVDVPAPPEVTHNASDVDTADAGSGDDVAQAA